MLTTIEALEKDIELFQKNIQGSNKLIEIIQSTIQAVEAQGTLFEDKTSALQELIRNIPENVEQLNEKSISEHKKNISEMLHTEHTIYIESVQGYKDQLIRCVNVLESKQVEYLHFLQELQTALEAALAQHSSDLTQIKTSLLEESRTAMSEMNAESAKTSAGHAEQVEKAVLDCKEHLAQCIVAIEAKQAEYLHFMQETQTAFESSFTQHNTDLAQFKTILLEESRAAMSEMNAESAKTSAGHAEQVEKAVLDCKDHLTQCIAAIDAKQTEYVEFMKAAQSSLDAACEKHSTDLSQFQTDLSAESRRVMTELTAENNKALADYLQQMKLLLDDTKASTISYTEKISDAVLGIARSEQRYEEHLQNTQKNFIEQIQNFMTALSDAQTHFDQKMLGINESLLSFIETLKGSNEEYANTVEAKVIAAVEAINEKDSELISKIDAGFEATKAVVSAESERISDLNKSLSVKFFKLAQKENDSVKADILKALKSMTDDNDLDKLYALMLQMKKSNQIVSALLGTGVLAAVVLGVLALLL